MPAHSNPRDDFAPLVDALGGDPSTVFDSFTSLFGIGASMAAAATRRSLELSAELTRIATGTSELDPRRDRRFADDTWSTNELYRRLGQSYLAWSDAVHGTVEDMAVDDEERKRLELAAEVLTSSAAPTNTLAGNPAALRRATETRGQSLVDGLGNLLDDIEAGRELPAMVDTEPFVVGETVAVSAGQVVFRNELLELIEYAPTTPQVHERPLLIVPPQINKYYILDLAPGRSLVEHAVAGGQRVFMISWRNPQAEHAEWSLDTYVDAIDEAMDAALEISGSPDLNLVGTCAGGITAAALAGSLAAEGDTRVNTLTFLVTVLDWSRPSTLGSFLTPAAMSTMRQRSRQDGVVSGAELAKTFAWLRPNDLIWSNWINNYLMGEEPSAFDILSWNADSTNLPAGLHSDFLEVAGDNALARPNELMVRGNKVDLSSLHCDVYVVAGQTDHITPWESAYQSLALFGGPTRFVLTGTGHIQTLVCPEDNPKARYFTNDARPAAAEAWREGADEHTGSWWNDWSSWLAGRSGSMVDAPSAAGGEQHRPIVPAPGTYVHAQA